MTSAIHHPRRPRASPLWQIVHHAWDASPVTELFRHRFLHALRAAKLVSAQKVTELLSWKHSGFHIDGGEKPVAPGDTKGRQRLAEYLLRAPFSLQKIHWNPKTHTVLYRSRHSWKTKRNFEVFKATDFLAAAIDTSRREASRPSGTTESTQTKAAGGNARPPHPRTPLRKNIPRRIHRSSRLPQKSRPEPCARFGATSSSGSGVPIPSCVRTARPPCIPSTRSTAPAKLNSSSGSMAFGRASSTSHHPPTRPSTSRPLSPLNRPGKPSENGSPTTMQILPVTFSIKPSRNSPPGRLDSGPRLRSARPPHRKPLPGKILGKAEPTRILSTGV